MTPGEVVITIFVAFVSGGVGVALWRRMDRFDDDLRALRAEMNARFAEMSSRMDVRFGEVDARFGLVDARFTQMESRMDADFRQMGDRLAGLQSDLTHVALAVGARPPRAEGE